MDNMNQEQQEPMAPQEGQENLPPEIEAYVGGIMKLMHGKETKGKVYEMLKSAPPEKSVPEAAFLANLRMAEAMKKKGKKATHEQLFIGQVFASTEAIEIGNAGGFFEEEIGEGNVQPVLQESIQRLIVEGVKRKMLDPIKIQEQAEQLLSPEQREMGLAAAEKTGVPPEAGTNQAMEVYANERVDREKAKMAEKQSVQNRQSQIQQAQRQGGL